MEELVTAAVTLGVLLLTAKLAEEVFKRIKLPGFIGAILTGLVLGPSVLGLIDYKNSEYIALFTMLGINFLLFIAGAEEIKGLGLAGKRLHIAFIAGIVTFIVPTIVMLIYLQHIGLSYYEALTISIIMGAVSVGPMVKALMDSGLISYPQGRLVIIVGIIAEVTAIIVFNSAIRFLDISMLVTAALALILLYMFGKYIFTELLHMVESYISVREAPFAILISLILLIGYIAEYIGISAALASLGLGVFSATYLEERPDLLERVKALTFGFLEPMFFAGLGLNIHSINLNAITLGLIIACIASIPKITLGMITFRNYRFGALMLSKGGVDAALLLTGLYLGVISTFMFEAIVVSMLVMMLLFSIPLRGNITSSTETVKFMVKVDDIMDKKIVVKAGTPITKVLNQLLRYGAMVVIDDEDHPLGYILASDVTLSNPKSMRELKVEQIMRSNVPVVSKGSKVKTLVGEDQTLYPIIAVIDDNYKVVGTLHYQDIIRGLKRIIVR